MRSFKSIPVLAEGFPYVIQVGTQVLRMDLESIEFKNGIPVGHFVGDNDNAFSATVSEDELLDIETNQVVGQIYATTDYNAPMC